MPFQPDQTTAVGVVGALAFGVLVLEQLRHRRGRYRIRFRPRRYVGRRTSLDNFSEAQRIEIVQRDNWRCRYCGVEVHFRTYCPRGPRRGCNRCYEADHKIPVIDGGLTHVDNGLTSCRFDNRQKGRKSVHQHIRTSRRQR